MSGSIVENLMSLLNPQVVAPVATQLGVSPDTIQRGLQSGSAALLAGMAAKAEQPDFLNHIYSLVMDPANGPGVLSTVTSNLGTLASGVTNSPIMNLGGRLLSSVFGSNLSSVTDAIGQSTGTGAGKAGTLLGIAAPLVLGVLQQHVKENSLSAAGLGSSLKSESRSLTGFLPVGLQSLLGGVARPVSAAPVYAAPVTTAPVKAATTMPWMWPVIVLVLLGLGLLWFFNRSRAPVGDAVQTAANTATNAGAAVSSALGDFLKTKLPNGVELNIPQFGIESKLIAFLEDSSKPVDTTTWFNFDRILFDTDKATLLPSSQEQVQNVVQILTAFPNAHVKIGGYTDNTGNAAANQALSEARAKTVMDAIVAGGIDPSRLEAKGYGDQYPVGDNATEAGRALNRRISLLVTQK